MYTVGAVGVRRSSTSFSSETTGTIRRCLAVYPVRYDMGYGEWTDPK